MPKIVIHIPNGEPVTHELSGASITIGRNPENTIILDEASISGAHAEFIKTDDGYLLRDLDSTNGTFVNGDPAGDTLLKHGDSVGFGTVPANFETKAGASAPAAPVEESLIHDVEEIKADLADSSARPSDFTSISPFPKKRKKTDPLAAAVMAIGVLSLLAAAGVAALATIMKSS